MLALAKKEAIAGPPLLFGPMVVGSPKVERFDPGMF
jgi:hypothetical protein